MRAQVGEVKLANTLVTEIVDLFRGPVVVAVHAHQLVEQRSLLVHGCRGKRVRRKTPAGAYVSEFSNLPVSREEVP